MAGLWDRATIDGETVDSFTILTTKPNTLMVDIHNRMPVIPPQDCITNWLKGSPEIRVDMIAPHDAQDMHAWKVGKDVGNVRNQSKELIAPVE
ncbi:SOS response-associated peptidase family protein [Hyphomonas adhaerens]